MVHPILLRFIVTDLLEEHEEAFLSKISSSIDPSSVGPTTRIKLCHIFSWRCAESDKKKNNRNIPPQDLTNAYQQKPQENVWY
jgi:hypothetical protein